MPKCKLPIQLLIRIAMKFVELVLSSTQRYAYKTASDIEMNILGDFLASDVGYRPLPFRQWAFDNVSQNANGNLTALQKNADSIVLTDIFAKYESPVALQMTHEQFVQILNDWQEKVCNIQPKAIIIQHENNQFIIEETIVNENDQIALYPAIKPHSYPLLIKISFILCCVFFFVSLFDFPYFFKINNKIKIARRAFNNKNYTDASLYYAELSTMLPTNKYIKLYLAQSLFKSEHIEDHMTALHFLSKIELKKKEWIELQKYMPAQYAVYFQDVKKG